MGDSCTLLPGGFGVLVQAALFFICLGILVIKKLLEHSDRSWSVFMLDSSKQVFGAGFIHVLNMLTSTVLGARMKGDACDWYWMNIMVDTTLGVFLEYLCLLGLTRLLEKALGDVRELRFGEYTDESGHIDRIIYAKQLGLWLSCIVGMKITVLLILVLWADRLYSLTCVLLALVSWNTQLKLVFVMILTPCCMNALQFWLTDNFIQKGGVSFRQLAVGCYGCCAGCWGCRCLRPGQDTSEDDFKQRDSIFSFDRERRESDGAASERRHSNVSAASERRHSNVSAASSRERRHSNLSAPLLEAGADAFEEERAELLDSIENLRAERDELSTAAARDRRDRELAEVQAKRSEEQMLDAQEQLHRVQQELRLHKDGTELLRDRLAVKEEKEHQLKIRVQQLEFSYSAAGAAANAVFAAEVSAAAVAASSAASGNGRRLGVQGQAPVNDGHSDLASTIDDFLGRRSGAPSTAPPTPSRPSPYHPQGLPSSYHPQGLPSSYHPQGMTGG